MNVARHLFILLNSAILLYWAFFLFSSIGEKEKRASLISMVVIILLMAADVAAFLMPNFAFFLSADIFILLFVFFLFAPFGSLSSVKIMGERSRFDERDIMFARGRYVPGSDAYSDYYQRRPERKKTDDALRAMPNLFEPAGLHYEPVAAKIADNNFEMNEKLIPFCNGEPATEKTPIDPDKATAAIKNLCLSLGAVDVGMARLDPFHLYSHVGRGPGGYGTPIKDEFENVIVFAVEMDFSAMQQAPKMPVVVESSKQYLEAAKIAINAASFIRSLGYNARAHMDANYRFMLPAVAVDAGLGEVGRIGYLIHPKYGTRIRLGAITTDMPLKYDKPITFGVQDFCRICKKCAADCPSGAISHGSEKNVRGVEKWSTNQEACYRYWRTVGTDCGICMRVCPYSKPANFAHDVIRTMILGNAAARKLAVVGDKVLYNYSRK
jgi:ferredoxin